MFGTKSKKKFFLTYRLYKKYISYKTSLTNQNLTARTTTLPLPSSKQYYTYTFVNNPQEPQLTI